MNRTREIEIVAEAKAVPVRVEAADPAFLQRQQWVAYAAPTIRDEMLRPTLLFNPDFLRCEDPFTSSDLLTVLHELGHAAHMYSLWPSVLGQLRWRQRHWNELIDDGEYMFAKYMHGKDSAHGPRWKSLTKQLGHPYPLRGM